MTWQAKFADGKTVRFDDLPPTLFQRAADGHPDIHWLGLYHTPASNIEAFHDLLVGIAVHVGAEPPAKPETMRDARGLLEFIERVEDDLPVEYENGFPQTAGDQATT